MHNPFFYRIFKDNHWLFVCCLVEKNDRPISDQTLCHTDIYVRWELRMCIVQEEYNSFCLYLCRTWLLATTDIDMFCILLSVSFFCHVCLSVDSQTFSRQNRLQSIYIQAHRQAAGKALHSNGLQPQNICPSLISLSRM